MRITTAQILGLAGLAALAVLPGCGSTGRGAPDKAVVGPGSFVVTPGGLFLAGFDTDGDFQVRKDELETGAPKAFAAADRDRNGLITATEFQEYAERAIGTDQAVPGRLYFDTNVDDKISEAEFVAGLTALLSEYDTNDDDVLVRKELLRQIALPGRSGGSRPLPR